MGSKRAKRRKRALALGTEPSLPRESRVESQETPKASPAKLPGTNMLKIASFLLILAGAASGVIAYYAMKNINGMTEETLIQITSLYGQRPADYMLSLIFSCGIGIVQIMAGYLGLKEAGNSDKVKTVLYMGITLLILEFLYQLFCLNTSSTMNWVTLISGLTLPIFYIWGIVKIRNTLKKTGA